MDVFQWLTIETRGKLLPIPIFSFRINKDGLRQAREAADLFLKLQGTTLPPHLVPTGGIKTDESEAKKTDYIPTFNGTYASPSHYWMKWLEKRTP